MEDTSANTGLDETLELFRTGKLAECIGRLEHICRNEPTNVKARSYLGAAYGRLGNYKDAVREFLELTRLDPTNAAHCLNLGMAYEALGKVVLAEGAYRKALDIAPDYQKAKNAIFRCIGI